MSGIQKFMTIDNFKQLDENIFQWRDRYGDFQRVTEMKTKHLFYTFLMIWNHSVKEEYKIWDNHYYEFPEFYTVEYMREAFLNLYKELKNRNDLGFKSKQVFEQIEDLLTHKKIEFS